jgi:hypothetical protein
MNLDFCNWCGCSAKAETLTDNRERFGSHYCDTCMELSLEVQWENGEPPLSVDLC